MSFALNHGRNLFPVPQQLLALARDFGIGIPVFRLSEAGQSFILFFPGFQHIPLEQQSPTEQFIFP